MVSEVGRLYACMYVYDLIVARLARSIKVKWSKTTTHLIALVMRDPVEKRDRPASVDVGE